MSPWRNRLARSAVNREVGGSVAYSTEIHSFIFIVFLIPSCNYRFIATLGFLLSSSYACPSSSQRSLKYALRKGFVHPSLIFFLDYVSSVLQSLNHLRQSVKGKYIALPCYIHIISFVQFYLFFQKK